MSYGSKEWANWVLESKEAVPLLKAAFDAGINAWDTANGYSNGESEKIIGRALKEYNIPRSQVVIMTKAFLPVDENNLGRWGQTEMEAPEFVNRCGLSRNALFQQVDASLKRLGTDYIDLLQIHRLDDTPFKEIMKALHDLIESGKVRYIGASSMWAHEFAQLQAIADANGWHRFCSMQNEHNLLYREEEREMNRYCKKTGVGLIPWGPIGSGALARPWSEQDKTDRKGHANGRAPDHKFSDEDEETIKRVEEVAKKRGWTMAQVAYAWSRSENTSPILGISSEKRLKEFLDAIEFDLTSDEKTYLEEPYKPKPLQGFNQARTTS